MGQAMTWFEGAPAQFNGLRAEFLPLITATPMLQALLNYEGDWADQVGAFTEGHSVRNDGRFWMANHAIADVTLSEPADGNDDWTDLAGRLPNLNVEVRTSNTQITSADHGKLIIYTGSSSFTQTFAAVSAFGAGGYVDFLHLGTGTITFDANGSETFGTVNAATTFALYPGEGVQVIAQASSGFRLVWLGPSRRPPQLFTSSGTYTPRPDKVRHLYRRWNGGQGGPASLNSSNVGAGGTYAEGSTNLTAAATVTIGAGGSAGSGAGGTTSITGGVDLFTMSGGPSGNLQTGLAVGLPGMGIQYGLAGSGNGSTGTAGQAGAMIVTEA
jgi:hypothetical protein